MATCEPSPFMLTPIDNICMRAYAPQILFFPESPGSDVSAVVATLRNSLSSTFQAIMQLSGTIQPIGRRGELCVSGPWKTVDDIFHLKDLRHDEGLDYRQLRDRNFPLTDVAPRILPWAYMKKSVKTVMLVQLTIIRGGMVMVLCLHHSFTDGHGATVIAKVWAAYCRGEDGSQLLTRDMIDRERLRQGWGSATLDDIRTLQLRPVGEKAPYPGIMTDFYNRICGPLMARFYRWTGGTEVYPGFAAFHDELAVVFFPTSKLAELKVMASSSNGKIDDNEWISTQDALCALISCCVHSTRDEEILKKTDRIISTSLLVGCRSKLEPPLPADYIGNCLDYAAISLPSRGEDSTPARVAEIAHLLRDQIKQRDDSYLRKKMAALKSVADLARVELASGVVCEDRVGFSSWSNQNWYSIDWGDVVGANIERVRFTGSRDNGTILPELKGPGFAEDERGLEVVLRLKKGQMDRLKRNELFRRFAMWRCD